MNICLAASDFAGLCLRPASGRGALPGGRGDEGQGGAQGGQRQD